MFDSFDKIRIISLPERLDRRREMMKELQRVGLLQNPRVRFLDAHRPADRGLFASRGAHGCFLSHLAALKEAAGKSLLILEDDCVFRYGAEAYTVPICDVFYGGFLEASDPVDPGAGEIIGSHCMGFSAGGARAAAAYLEALLDPSYPPDPIAASEASFQANVRPPIDGAYVWFRRAHPELTVHFAPHLSRQRPSRSDITPRMLDQLPGASRLMGSLRKMKERLRCLTRS